MIRRAARWAYDTLEAGIDADNDFVSLLSVLLTAILCLGALTLIVTGAWYIALIHPALPLPYFAALGYLALAIIHTNTDQEDQ